MFDFEMEKKKVKEELKNHGVSEEQAEIISDCFATADLYGVSSHGCAMLSAHIKKLKQSGYNLNPNFQILNETAAFAVVNGDNAFGPVSAMFCLDFAISKCKGSGMFTVFSRNNNTFGPAFYYSLKAAEKGYIALVCSNSPAQMAPIGGKEKMLGTNPFSIVLPVPGRDPIIIDMATSVVAKSKFKQYKEAGKKLPEGWALDKDGSPTTDPDEAIQGMVLPMAGFKGYAIAMLIDVMSGVLSGASYLNKVGRFYSESGQGMDVGFHMTVLDPMQITNGKYDANILEFVNLLENSDSLSDEHISLPGADRISIKNKKGSQF